MAGTSRYDSGSSPTTDVRTTSSGITNTQGTQATSSSGTQSTSSDQTQTQNSTTKNMSGSEQQTLDQLLRQLASGGTAAMKLQTANRQGEIANVQQQRAGYSKEAAFGDSQGLVSQQMRRVLEQLMPGINRAAEDAGSSGGALRALLIQDAASKAVEASSALGVQTATNYGQVSANLSQVLERLTSGDDAATSALVNALNVAKGSTQTSSGTVRTVGTSSQTSQQQGTSSTQGSTQANENKVTDYAPFQLVDTTPKFYGPVESPVDSTKFIGTTADTLAQLAGTGNPWQSYSF